MRALLGLAVILAAAIAPLAVLAVRRFRKRVMCTQRRRTTATHFQLSKRSCLYLSLLAVVCFQTPLHSTAATIVSASSTVDVGNQAVDFHIQFSDAPDFSTVDAFGRQADSFQFFVDSDAQLTPSTSPGSALIDVIVRGEEIHIDGDLRIRDRNGDGGPGSGGWGPIRGSVPIATNGRFVSFTIDFTTFNETDGVFNYLIETYRFGAWTRQRGFAEGGGVYVPEPSSILDMTLALALLMARRHLRLGGAGP